MILATKGSQTDLTLSALYFDGREYPMMTMKEVISIDGERATAIPLHMRFTSLGTTIVGTTDDYYQLRGLTLAEGTWGQRFGDCVIGASAAKTLNVSSGDFLRPIQRRFSISPRIILCGFVSRACCELPEPLMMMLCLFRWIQHGSWKELVTGILIRERTGDKLR